MAAHPRRPLPEYSREELELARDGKLRLRTRSILDVLTEIGPPPGATSEVGTGALQDVRDDRA